MEQQQFKVSFSLGTKLLMSVVLLLFIVIIFLNVSAILLLKEDKRAYTYQSQSTEAVLAGREFVNTAQRALGTLRISLASIDPLRPITPQQKEVFQSIVDNQSELVAASAYLFDVVSAKLSPVGRATREKEIKEYQLNPLELDLSEEAMRSLYPELIKNSFGFYNPSKVGGTPVLAVLFADLKLQTNPSGMPIVVGMMPLDRQFRNDLKGLNLTIATKSGRVLFDTDPDVFFSKKTVVEDPLFKTSAASQLSNGAIEYELDGKKYLGSYVHSGLDLMVLNRTEWSKAIKATYELTEKFILLGLMAIGAAIIFAIFFSKTLTAPLNRLYKATKEVANGNFDLSLNVGSRDEIGALTDSFNVMSHKISELIEERMEKVQIENELKIASTVQEQLIPGPTHRDERIFIRSFYMSASQCGGDWWGFFSVGNKTCVMIADATGHGLPSALITASARSCFSIMHKLAQEDPDFSFSPSAMLSYANRVIFDASLGKIMMTFFVGVLDFDTKTLSYSSAGHNPPWFFRKSDDGYSMKSLVAAGPRLGEHRVTPDFEELSVPFDRDDILFLYTDGLLEGKDKAGNMFGKKRMKQVIESALAGGPDLIINNLVGDFFKHNDEKPLDDDLTLAAIAVLSTHAERDTTTNIFTGTEPDTGTTNKIYAES